ncbi:hypothetical protein ELH51_05725 [Rhizobium ruizarguesonis]|jgi:hypothetical protein|uniref:hypothetical protein n=1 Tax=Rhizobium ruizarguesonis TaxID=2081791 RepID=UPI0010321348|nr:hypothetical protein [Rhizobium ruizarguesonis]TBB21312.1 hypothetical protein ELH51_05725 [Rhizobium ruizarguesonis]
MQKHSNGGGAVLIGVPVAPMTELYWGPLAPFKIVEAHDEMVKAIQGRPDIQLLTANVRNKHSGVPSGRFDIAIDVRSGDGCGMYRSLMMVKSTGEMHDLATPPLWYQFKDPQDVIAKVYKFLTGMQFFENLDAFADHAINLNEAEASGQIH